MLDRNTWNRKTTSKLFASDRNIWYYIHVCIYIYIYIHTHTKPNAWIVCDTKSILSRVPQVFLLLDWFNRTLACWFECSPMARETRVQSEVESYQSLKKWYLTPPCLILSIRRYGSRVKWSNPGKGVAPFPTPWCITCRKGSLRVTFD